MALEIPPAVLLQHPAFGPAIRAFIGKVVRVYQPGMTVTSWYRSPQANARVGGNADSQHLFGLGLDLAGPNRETAAELARRINLPHAQEVDHLHLQLFRPGVLRRAGVSFPLVPESVRVA